MNGNVFTYGTLMFDSVWRSVAGRLGPHAPARLYGYRRRGISGVSYPGIVPGDAEEYVDGLLYLKVDGASLAAIDAFEDEGTEYRRIVVRVRLHGGGVCSAWAYEYLHPGNLEERGWDPSSRW
ncbi:MAG: gamma-glutamylcyclotransferase family protein [Spirochaetales bacterium]